ncbi:hypothetical protein STENM327S_09368 [Streptomyces tendae]
MTGRSQSLSGACVPRAREPRACIAVGCESEATSYSAWYRTSPERSPVNIRPVRLPPWAAGASPTISSLASAGPKPGTGLPQYVQSAKAARFVPGDLLAPLDQPRAGPAPRDALVESQRPPVSMRPP